MAPNVKKLDEKVGDILKKAREKTKRSTVRVAKDICIRRVYLEAIEECQYDKTPGIAYTVGFIRSYADYLGLPADEIVKMFNKENRNEYFKDQISPEDEEGFKEEIKKEDKSKCVKQCVENCRKTSKIENFIKENILYVVGVLGAVLLILIISLIISSMTKNSDNESLEVAPVIAESLEIEGKKAEADTPYFQAVKEKEEAEKKTKEKGNAFDADNKIYGNVDAHEIKLQAGSEVWVQVTDIKQNKVIFSKILMAGDEYRTFGNKDYALTVGNAGGLKVILNDMDLGVLGKDGQKKIDIILEKRELQEYFN